VGRHEATGNRANDVQQVSTIFQRYPRRDGDCPCNKAATKAPEWIDPERPSDGCLPAGPAEGRAIVGFETRPGEQLQIDFGERRVEFVGVMSKAFFFVATLGRPSNSYRRKEILKSLQA
jgi:hypothetical protein